MAKPTDINSSEPEFSYQPLPDASRWIRVLRLVPSHGMDMLHCLLENQRAPTTLKRLRRRSSKYCAISYTWQPVEPRQEIRLNGAKTMIGYNLYLFLRKLVKADSDFDRCYWADALCIDQQNLLEKAVQVSLMRSIYLNAQQLLIWLGDTDSTTDLAIDVVNKCGLAKSGAPLREVNDSIQHWKSIAALCERPYWSRLWIIQEISTSIDITTIFCGKKSCQLQSLKHICVDISHTFEPPEGANIKRFDERDADIMRYITIFLTTSMRRLCAEGDQNSVNKDFATRPTRHLSELVSQHRTSQCGEPRDHVYALLAIAFDEIPDPLKPDYLKCLYTLYWDFLATCSMITNLHLILFENLGLEFAAAENNITTTKHVLDDLEVQKSRGLSCPCETLYVDGTLLDVAEVIVKTAAVSTLKSFKFITEFESNEKGFAIGNIEDGDTICHITMAGIKLIFKGDSLTYVGVAFTCQGGDGFEESHQQIQDRLEYNHNQLLEIVPRALREIPAHVLDGEVEYDLVLDRRSLLFFMSVDTQVLERIWPSDGTQVMTYSDPGLQAVHRARTVRILKSNPGEASWMARSYKFDVETFGWTKVIQDHAKQRDA